MPGADLNQSSECFLSSFGVLARACELFRRERADQGKVPIAQCNEGGERLLGVINCISLRPQVLIEGLDGVIVERKRLPISEAKRKVAIRQMSDDLARAPLSGRDRLVDARLANLARKFCQPRSSARKYSERILISQIRRIRSVWIGHRNKVAELGARLRRQALGLD